VYNNHNRYAVFQSLLGQLETANPTTLLLIAEAAARGVDPSVARSVAAAAIAASLGYPLSQYPSQWQTALRSTIDSFMGTLRPLVFAPGSKPIISIFEETFDK
jgi:hypothetical protein